MKVMKETLLVIKTMKHLHMDQYIDSYFKQFGLEHLTLCVYQFIGDDMELIPNILHLFVYWIGNVY